jgi:uncharacterized protein
MYIQHIDLLAPAPGLTARLQVLRFGKPSTGPKAYIQAALHADEVPAILAALELKKLLLRAEAAGELLGEVVLVPYANPLGLAQHVHGQHHGRFSLSDGLNFNRGYPELAGAIADRIRPQLSTDMQANVARIRAALREATLALPAINPTQDLKRRLLQMAIDSDVVLDLHCDSDAVMHLYSLTPHTLLAQELGAQLGAQAVLLATDSGDSPFDEACSRPWLDLQKMMEPSLGQAAIPLACFGATVELRGEADVTHEFARQDAQALLAFLQSRGVVGGTPAGARQALCEPTPLSGSEPITAPSAGVVVFLRRSGDHVNAGDAIADIVNPDTGDVTTLHCKSGGVMYARCSTRWAAAGKRLAKIAGTSLARSGKLLSP